MKAMTCPQCGALIKKISLREKFAECEYCDARILLEENRDRIVEVADQPEPAERNLPLREEHQENHRKVNQSVQMFSDSYHYPEPENRAVAAPLLIGLVVLVLGIGIFAGSKGCFSRPLDEPEETTVKPTASPGNWSSTPRNWSVPVPTPAPRVNYQVKVQWTGDNDMEHFENPQIDFAKLPTNDPAELRKTVFKNRAVQVRVTISADGEVTSAEALSGHPVLKEAAVQAAKKTLFNSRPKPTGRVLTYYFRLLDE